MQPRPRDLTSGKFKIRSTSPRSPVTQAELVRTITNGIPGTAMPSFRFLTEGDRRALAEYVASLAKLPSEDKAEAVAVPPEPPVTPERLAEGKQLYSDLGCAACHGEQGRGDGAAAPYLKDEWGSKTPPRDLTREPYKGGDSDRDVYLRFAAGMPGTPMPSYADTIAPEKVWSLVMYVQSLRLPQPAATAGDQVARGKELLAQKHCLACHTLPEGSSQGAGVTPADGGRQTADRVETAGGGRDSQATVLPDRRRRGGSLGPPLDLAARQLNLTWAREFLLRPREQGKIFPAFPYRMPDLGLTPAEVDAILAYLAAAAGRAYDARAAPTPRIETAELVRGRALFAVSCAACHHLAGGPPTAPSEQQGPSLARARQRLDFDFMLAYVADPRRYNPRAVMTPTHLRPDDVGAIAAFVWTQQPRVTSRVRSDQPSRSDPPR
jgi:mono/diheme cytochrome c family protein